MSDKAENLDSIKWTVYGKIQAIYKHDGTVINYTYDPSGNRISKAVRVSSITKKTFYVRDAGGNVMSVYLANDSLKSCHLTQSEIDLYGSSRLGVYNVMTDVQNCYDTTNKKIIFTRGSKFFELCNHLGNVLATISDKNIQVSNGATPAMVDYYNADIITANDYYPFGMIMPDRKYSAGSAYRYGFNGQEKSGEIDEALTTAEYWEYDSRIGRRWNMDPECSADESPYSTNHNNPILFSDPNGKFPIFGFVIGFFTEIVIQAVEIKLGIRKEFNFTEAVISGVATQIGMGIAKQIGRIKTLSKLVKGVAEFVSDVAVNSAEQYAKTGQVDLKNAVFNASVAKFLGSLSEIKIKKSDTYASLSNTEKRLERYNRNNPKPTRAASVQKAKEVTEGFVEVQKLKVVIPGTSVASRAAEAVQSSASQNVPSQANSKTNDIAVTQNNLNQATPQVNGETRAELIARYYRLREEDYNKNGRIRKTWTDSTGVLHSSDEHNPNYHVPKNLDKNY